MYNRHQKELEKNPSLAKAMVGSKKMPDTKEKPEDAKAPYTIRCASTDGGEVWRIPGERFFTMVLKDQKTKQTL